MSFTAPDGSWNVTVVPGTSYTGLYAVDGSMNVVVSTGSTYVGSQHPCGASWVTVSPGTSVSREAFDGSLYVNTTGSSAGQRVTVVSGSLTPGGTTATYYIYGF